MCTENRKPAFWIWEKASDGSRVLVKNLEALTTNPTHAQSHAALSTLQLKERRNSVNSPWGWGGEKVGLRVEDSSREEDGERERASQ